MRWHLHTVRGRPLAEYPVWAWNERARQSCARSFHKPCDRLGRSTVRNKMLFWASLETGELVAVGALDAAAAEQSLGEAAADIGLTHEPGGDRAVLATIRSGFERAEVAHAAP